MTLTFRGTNIRGIDDGQIHVGKLTVSCTVTVKPLYTLLRQDNSLKHTDM